MRISVRQAKDQLDQLVSRAEAGEEVILVDGERPVATIAALNHPQMHDLPPDLAARRQRLLDISARAAIKKKPGSDAAHASDFLFDEYGMPG
jgi:antitoxin (DNA-binding transcriptional repressor) of toxin-antitoxin stability system